MVASPTAWPVMDRKEPTMHPETVIALAHISEINRRLADPMTSRRLEASTLYNSAQRARRRAYLAQVRRAVQTAARGRRIGGPAAA